MVEFEEQAQSLHQDGNVSFSEGRELEKVRNHCITGTFTYVVQNIEVMVYIRNSILPKYNCGSGFFIVTCLEKVGKQQQKKINNDNSNSRRLHRALVVKCGLKSP